MFGQKSPQKSPIKPVVFVAFQILWLTHCLMGSAVAQPPPNHLESHLPTAVTSRFADLTDVIVQSPGLQANRTSFTSDTEIEQFLASLPKGPNWRYKSMFKTEQGRDAFIVRFGKQGESASLPKRKLNVWILAQQHGNEPAGCEAALDIIRRFALQKEFKDKLAFMNVFVVPRANPDGAAVNKRGNAIGADLNRDHLSLQQPEVVALHRFVRDDLPDLVIDLHEFTVGGRWLERYGAVQASDVMLQSASHPMVDKGLRRLTAELFEPALNRALRQHQLRSFVYHTLNTESAQSYVQMGGNYAGIARNAFGLYGAVSYLVETRGVGINREHLQRRVASHVVVVKALLESAVQHREAIIAAVNKARTQLSTTLMVDHQPQRENIKLPMLDPVTGEDKEVEVEFQNSTVVKSTLERNSPTAYLLDESQTEAVAVLRNHGVTVVALGEKLAAKLNQSAFVADRYLVQEVRKIPGDSGASSVRVKTSLLSEPAIFKPGMFYVGLNQPLGKIVATALEPEGAGSYASVGVIHSSNAGATSWQLGDKLPVWRLMQNLEVQQAGQQDQASMQGKR
jgi:hypothetical protein